MIELCVRPAICAVAPLASDRETRRHVAWVGGAFVLASVAGITLRRQPLKLTGCGAFVTSLTLYRRMSADEREAVLMVANRGYGNIPAFNRVA